MVSRRINSSGNPSELTHSATPAGPQSNHTGDTTFTSIRDSSRSSSTATDSSTATASNLGGSTSVASGNSTSKAQGGATSHSDEPSQKTSSSSSASSDAKEENKQESNDSYEAKEEKQEEFTLKNKYSKSKSDELEEEILYIQSFEVRAARQLEWLLNYQAPHNEILRHEENTAYVINEIRELSIKKIEKLKIFVETFDGDPMGALARIHSQSNVDAIARVFDIYDPKTSNTLGHNPVIQGAPPPASEPRASSSLSSSTSSTQMHSSEPGGEGAE